MRSVKSQTDNTPYLSLSLQGVLSVITTVIFTVLVSASYNTPDTEYNNDKTQIQNTQIQA